MTRTTCRFVLVACAGALLVPAAAGAHRFNAPTTAEITSGGPTGAEGSVDSPRAACTRNRLVELFREDDLGGEPQSYGTDRTDRQGNFRVDASLLAGQYYVEVSKSRVAQASKKKKKKKHKHRCKGAVSLTVQL